MDTATQALATSVEEEDFQRLLPDVSNLMEVSKNIGMAVAEMPFWKELSAARITMRKVGWNLTYWEPVYRPYNH